MNLVDQIRKGKKMMKNRRRDVVRQITIEPDAPSAGNRGQIGFQNIAVDDREIREFFGKPLESSEEQHVQLDGIDGCSGGLRQLLSSKTMDPARVLPPESSAEKGRWHARSVRASRHPRENVGQVVDEPCAESVTGRALDGSSRAVLS